MTKGSPLACRCVRFLRRQERQTPSPGSFLPRQLPTHPTSPQQHLSRPPHVAPVDFPNDYPPPPSQPLASSVHASSPRFSQHQSSARTAPALSYTTTPTRRPKPRLRGASLQLWLRRNADFFTCMPQSDDALLHISAIHASVCDGGRASCVAPRMHRLLAHNEMHALHVALRHLRDGWREGAVCSPPSRA